MFANVYTQVISTIYLAMGTPTDSETVGGQDSCVPGQVYNDLSGECEACPAGTFHALVVDPFCTACAPGQVKPWTIYREWMGFFSDTVYDLVVPFDLPFYTGLFPRKHLLQDLPS